MTIRKFAALAAVALASAVLGTSAGVSAAVEDLGEFTVGDTVAFTFSCPFDGNDFFLFLGDSKVDEQQIDASADYLLGYQYDTSALEPGEYSVGIECNDTEGIFDYEFTLVAVDPCAPVDTVEIPRGPSRAPHSVPVICEGSGIPFTGPSESTTTILMVGALAVVVGTGLLIARRRTLA